MNPFEEDNPKQRRFIKMFIAAFFFFYHIKELETTLEISKRRVKSHHVCMNLLQRQLCS